MFYKMICKACKILLELDLSDLSCQARTQGRDRVLPPPSWANYFKSMQFFHQKLNLHP